MNINDERNYKINRIIEEYGKRYIQEEVAEKFGMSVTDVGRVLRMSNYTHTRLIDQDNRRPEERINLVINLNACGFLDKYPIANFMQ